MRLAGERAGGSQVVVAALTRRLLQRSGTEAAVAARNGARRHNMHRELLLGFAQQKALAAQVPVAPVAPPADAEAWLAQRATISRSPEALRINFESADGQSASLLLKPAAVHSGWPSSSVPIAARNGRWTSGLLADREFCESVPVLPQALH